MDKYYYYSSLQDVPLPTEPAFRRNGYVTFGNFSDFAKLNDEVLHLWGKILKQVPKSYLLLKAAAFDGKEVEAYARQRLVQAGLPLARVKCQGISADYLVEYGNIDIALDIFPYSDEVTGWDALYMGRPLVTLNERFLMDLDLEELASASTEEYVEQAVMLAQNPDLLQDLQLNLRSILTKSPLMNKWCCRSNLQVGNEEPGGNQAVQQLVLNYREKMQEEKIVNLLIHALDEADGDLAQRLLRQLRLPDARYYYLQGEILALQEDFAASDSCCHKALGRPVFMEAWLRGGIYHRLAENAKQQGNRQTAAHYYLWSSQYKSMEQGKAVDYSNYLFNLNYMDTPAAEMLTAARNYGQIFASIRQYDHQAHPVHRKLRIGYISPDFCRHVVATFSQAFLRAFDRMQYDVFVYADCRPDDVTCRMMTYPVSWRNIYGLTPAAKAEMIYRDEVDILVDLSGHTGHNALPVLAYKPAPLQLSGIGYFATTGLAAIDYFITDQYTALPEDEAYFSEKLLRLPHSHFCYTPLQERNPALIVPCGNTGCVTLGTMNQFDKVTDEMLQLWSRIMAQIPKVRLLLKSGAFDKDYRLADARRRIKKAGISLGQVEFAGFTKDYWQFYENIDIALDTYPYPGGGSTCDALYMGVPVVSLYGRHHHQRFGYSLLQNSGLGDWAVETPEEYVQAVVRLAGGREHMQLLRQQVAVGFRQGTVMAEQDYMRALENLYQIIWRERHGALRADVSGNV